jgi:V/A-type H+-transporting ATPase subunit F
MSDVAFIGDRDTVWPFKALGNAVFFSDEHESLSDLVTDVSRRQFSIIFVTEEVYESTQDIIEMLSDLAVPTFAVLPSVKGRRGIAMQLIRDSVRKAMGAEFI